MMEIPEEIQLAVKQGSNELTEKYPGWFQAVHLESLDMASSEACVLAHVAGYINLTVPDYYAMLNVLAPRDEYNIDQQIEWSKDNGFTEDDRSHILLHPDEDANLRTNWYFMDAAWILKIKELRGE